ncbi:hypothetical protein V6B33_16420 [Mangrovibacillus sp. Mu-81]|uniref:hypothetical protein n=1 Tax=Bacillaceae TaxID=186817 RepID=UPI002494D37C|nr:hypothetical protein [Rossellomorea aquimaris]
MNNIEWITIGINAAISLFLSLILFALGLRAGKERAERKELREKYRNIYSYLKKFRDGIEEGNPLYWRHFVNSVHDSFTPYLEEMMDKGDHVELNKGLFPQIIELEKDCLSYGWSFQNLSLKAGEIVEEVLIKNGVSLKKEKYQTKTSITDTDSEKSGPFFEYNPTKLIHEKEFNYVLNRLENSEVGISFRYVQESNIKYQIHIRQADTRYLDIFNIFSQIRCSLVEIKDKDRFLVKEDELIYDINKLLNKLEKRIREPYTFWSTVGNSIKDIFLR